MCTLKKMLDTLFQLSIWITHAKACKTNDAQNKECKPSAIDLDNGNTRHISTNTGTIHNTSRRRQVRSGGRGRTNSVGTRSIQRGSEKNDHERSIEAVVGEIVESELIGLLERLRRGKDNQVAVILVVPTMCVLYRPIVWYEAKLQITLICCPMINVWIHCSKPA